MNKTESPLKIRAALVKELSSLATNISPKARVPRHFDLWSLRMQVMWLKAHQK